MAELTQQQARALAQLFSDLSEALLGYRSDNWDKLTEEQRSTMEALQKGLLHFSYDLTIEAVRQTLDDIAVPVQHISDAKDKMNAAIKKLSDVNKVIGLAAAAIKLGAAIVTGQPAAIGTAIKDAIQLAAGAK